MKFYGIMKIKKEVLFMLYSVCNDQSINSILKKCMPGIPLF